MARRIRVSVWLIRGVTSSKEPIVLSSKTFASACESAAGVFNCASLGSLYLLLPIIRAYFMDAYFFTDLFRALISASSSCAEVLVGSYSICAVRFPTFTLILTGVDGFLSTQDFNKSKRGGTMAGASVTAI